jgi:hypothetical protein
MEEMHELMEMIVRKAWNRRQTMRQMQKRRELMRKERRKTQWWSEDGHNPEH